MHRGSGNQIASFCGQVVFRFAGKGNQLGRDDYFDRDSRSDCDRQDYAARHVQGLQNACGLDCGRGILVAVLSRYGISQLAAVPQVTVMLVIGTILGVVFLKGVAAGPVIASGMAYVIISLLGLSFK